MNLFTISDLQRFSGINVHSIRAWEKRYQALQPERSEGNTRYYNGHQLRRLLNISSLMDMEYKISELCSFSDAKLHELISERINQITHGEYDDLLVTQMVTSALTYDEELFERIFSRAVISHGMEGAYLHVIYPVLNRLGVLWSTNQASPGQEHFIIHLIKQKLYTAIDLLPLNLKSSQHWVLFLPENEFHEIGLLVAGYLIRNAGHRCTYLGSNVPELALKEVVSLLQPNKILLFLVSKNEEEADLERLKQLHGDFPKQTLYVATQPSRFNTLKLKRIQLLHSLKDLKSNLKNV